jgi:ABC-type transport system involved in multi-copper enzyme maturation permease subunit
MSESSSATATAHRGVGWWEWLSLALVLAGCAALAVWGPSFSLSLRVGLWAALAIVLAAVYLLGRFGRGLLGPVFFYDLVRAARGGRSVILRCAYLAILLATLFLLYWQSFGTGNGGLWDVWTAAAIQRSKLADFTAAFFWQFMTVQFAAVVVLTPAVTAGAIADEKERKTLDYLLTTDLNSQEIVLGKLASRLAYLLLLVLTGLPVLGILTFLGGVDPNLMLAGFLATGMTLLGLAGLSMFNSVYCRKPRTAILVTYLEAAVYLIASTPLGLADVPPPVSWLASGNIVCALHVLATAAAGGKVAVAYAGNTLHWVLLWYCVFHGVVALAGILTATLPLRAWSRHQASKRGQRAFVLGLKQRRLPRITGNPLTWKELYAEPMLRFNRLGVSIVGAIVAFFFLVSGFLVLAVWVVASVEGRVAQHMNSVVRVVTAAVGCLLLLGVAVRSAASLGGERDRDTLDSLLTTPVENGDLLWSKWLGSVLSGRKLWWYPLTIFVIGLLTGGLSLLALPLVLLAWGVYAMFLAALGLWFSLVCRTTTRAYLWTLLTIAGVCVGNWLLTTFASPFLFPPAASRGQAVEAAEWLELGTTAIVPPATLYEVAFYDGEFKPDNYGYYTDTVFLGPMGGGSSRSGSSLVLWKIEAALLGLTLYGIAGVVLWLMTVNYFPRVTRRMPLVSYKAEEQQRQASRAPTGATVVGGWG